MNLNWDDVRYFLAVCRRHSFVGAASELKVTHTTVARRISSLEEALQTRLFLRTERGTNLTPAGESLLPYAEQIESNCINITAHVSEQENPISGVIRIGAPDGIGTYFLSSCLAELQSLYPHLEVELIAVPVYYSLSKREIDILITVHQPSRGKTIFTKLIDYQLGLFSSASYLAGKNPPATRKELRQHRLVGYIEEMLFDQDLDFMEEILPGLSAEFRTPTVVAQLQAVKAGAGIGVIPFFMAHQEPDLIPILAGHSIRKSYWLQVNPDSQQLARVKTTIEFITGQIKAAAGQFLEYHPPT